MKKILFPILTTFFAVSLNAASIRGGEITFRQIAPLTLEAAVNLYIQANATATVPDSISLCWGDGNCSTAFITNGIDADNDGLPDGEQLRACWDFAFGTNVAKFCSDRGVMREHSLS